MWVRVHAELDAWFRRHGDKHSAIAGYVIIMQQLLIS